MGCGVAIGGGMKPLAVDLFCGLGGWSEGLLAECWDVVGFDIEAHRYGEARYPAQLVIQDVLTIHGSQFKGASLIVASPPCQEFSYMAMPWTRAKEKARKLREDPEDRKRLTALFDACFRIQREAIAAAGHHIPMVVENVRGAQPWVGRARTHFGSFYLWGDVPALMPIVKKRAKVGSLGWSEFAKTGVKSKGFNTTADQLAHGRADVTGTHFETEGAKVPGFRFDGSGKSFQTASVEGSKTLAHVNKRDGHSHTRHLTNQREHDAVREGLKHGGDWFSDPTSPSRQGGVTKSREGVKQQAGIGGPRENGKGDAWFQNGAARHGSKSNARKAASAAIAKIPPVLARHIAAYYKPESRERVA